MSNTPEQLFLIHWEKEAPHTAAIVRARKEARSDHYYVHYSDMKEMEIKARALQKQRDEAMAEVERLRKALDAGPCDCDGRFICERCHILGKKPPTVATNDTSPEIFEAHGREWYKFTAGDQQPCAGNLKVCVLWPSDSKEVAETSDLAQNFDWTRKPPKDFQVIGWRPADAPEKLTKMQDS